MGKDEEKPYRVVAAVGDAESVMPLITLSCAFAGERHGRVTVLTVTPDGAQPAWLVVPEMCHGVPVKVDVRQGTRPSAAILKALDEEPPDLLLVGWQNMPRHGRYLLGSTLDPVIQRAPCPVAVLRVSPRSSADRPGAEAICRLTNAMWGGAARWRVLVPAGGGPNAALAIELALSLAANVTVTALYVARQSLGASELALGQERLKQTLSPWADDSRVQPKVVQARGVVEGVLAEAPQHDLLLIGMSGESMVERALFGNIPQRVALESPVPAIVVRRGTGRVGSWLRRLGRTLVRALPRLDVSDRAEILRDVWRDARPDADFYVMMALAAAIAALGLLLNSPAVIIGAMLVAPLMAAVLGVGMGVVHGDARLLRVALRAIARGVLTAVLVGVIVGALVPNKAATPELLARTRPGLLDLAVALVSGAAGAYAVSRKDVSASLPGVAISAALVPPLATVGIGLMLGNMAMAGGALLLFITNMVAISAAAALVFLLLGFGPEREAAAQRARVFRGGMAGTIILLGLIFVILATVTATTLRAAALRQAVATALQQEVSRWPSAQVADWQIVSNSATRLELDVTLRSTDEISDEEAAALRAGLTQRLGRAVYLTLSVLPVRQLAPE